jgi:hypothetical protein
LRHFLGVCNYHHRIVIDYAEYVAPLLVLLKKESKWKWTPDLDKAIEKLRSKFANSVHLLHQDESLPYTINTDASGKAIGAVLMQTNRQGETYLVSTASRVLSQTERLYSVAGQELLANVYAIVEKFRIFIYVHEVHLHTNNKALTFLSRCALTSSRMDR